MAHRAEAPSTDPRSRRPARSRSAVAWLLAGLAGTPAFASDNAPPGLSNFLLGNCNGVLQTSVFTDTGTPTYQVTLQDAGTSPAAGFSGLRIGNTPIVGIPNPPSTTALLLNFDEAAGAALDQSGNGNNASVTGPTRQPSGVPATPGIFGNEMVWNGAAGSQAAVPAFNGAYSTVTTHMTMEAWIKVADTNPHPILSFSSGTLGGVQLWTSSSPVPGGTAPGNLFVNFAETTTAMSHMLQTAPGALTANVYHLVAATYDGVAASLYIDGVLQSSASVSLSTVTSRLAAGYTLYVGNDPAPRSGTSFNGSMDQVRVLNVALTGPNVEADYYSGLVKVSTINVNGPFLSVLGLVATSYNPVAADSTTAVETLTVLGSTLNFAGNNFVAFSIEDKAGNLTYDTLSINVATHLPGSPALSAVLTTTGSVQWSWTKPGLICAKPSASLYSCGSNTPLYTALGIVPNGGSLFESNFTPGSPMGFTANSLQGRRVGAADAFGASALTSCTSAYTLANPPGAFQSSNISTGSMALQWGPNANPGNTRYELGQWNGTGFNFTTFISSPVTIANNFASTAYSVGNLTPATTYFWTAWAVNGSSTDFLGGQYTAVVSTVIPTLPIPPANLTQTPLGVSSISWSWATVPTAVSYTLSGAGGVVYDGPIASFVQTGVTANTASNLRVAARNQSGSSTLAAGVTGYSMTDQPTGTAVTAVYVSSISVSWSPGTNPPNTLYQVIQAIDPQFATLATTTTVSATNATITGLYPGTQYYIRVRALNGNDVPGPFDAVVSAATPGTSAISITPAPPTPYAPLTGTVALWHFDEGTGSTTVDAASNGNTGALTCLSAGCVSTPTWVGASAYPGLSGLGSKVLFSGGLGGLVSVAPGASLAFGGSVSAEAWVYPTTSLQVSSAGVVAKGNGGDETFVLGLSPDGAGKGYFLVRDASGANAYAVESTGTLPANAWTQLAGVYDQPNSTLRLYVNGAPSATGPGPAAGHANAHAVSIGNRQSSQTAYDLPFTGAIDEVHLLNRVLLSTEAAADYSSSLPQTLVPAGPAQNVSLVLPPNAFGGAANVYISSDPMHSPVSVSPAVLASGLASPPHAAAGQPLSLISGSVVEIVVTVGGQPFGGTLGSPAKLDINYPDADNNGFVDGTNPPVPVQNLQMFTLDPLVLAWNQIPTSVDTVNKRVEGLTPHFSIFGLFGATSIQADLSQAVVYPNPWRPGWGGRFDSAVVAGQSGLVFANLPASGNIRIFNLAGEKVVELPITAAASGTAVWDGRNSSGHAVASGVYLAYIKSGSMSSVLKFAVER